MSTDPTPDQAMAGAGVLLPDEQAVLATVRKMLEEPGAGFTHSRRYAVLVRAVDRLAAAVEAAQAVAAKHEHGATRWEDPLPVPSWIAELREAISRALLGGEPGA